MTTLAALDTEAIVAIITTLVAAAIAILKHLEKQKAAGIVQALWLSLQDVAKKVPSNDDNGNPIADAMHDMVIDGAKNPEQLREFVHRIISLYQAKNPGDRKAVGGNAVWNELFKQLEG
jgi:hypothetical protein